MARQRKPLPVGHSNSKYVKKSPSHTKKYGGLLSYWKRGLAFICLLLAGVIGYMGYLETRVNTPFDEQKMVKQSGLDVPDRYWGSYRPGLYFGMKTRDPYSVVFGLMWYLPRQLRPRGVGIRHWCDEGDNLGRYGWIEHDGRTFGVQEIEDGPFKITVSFVKNPGGNHGGDWTARISAATQDNQLQNELISFLLYSAIDEKTKGWIKPYRFESGLSVGVSGETEGLGAFTLKLYNQSGQVEHESYLSTTAQGLHVLKETVFASLREVIDRRKGNQKFFVLPGELLPSSGADGKRVEPNFVVTQITARVPFELDMAFESGSHMDRSESLIMNAYSRELSRLRKDFHNRFEETFKLQTKGYKTDEIAFAKAAFSNLLGGVGYFYGASRVESPHTRSPVPYWKAPLYSAVPSRSFFPRGFLWDEGFHGLLISSWDLDIELDIISHWFDLMNVEGWIPREQILGQEALSRVPEQFITQRNSNANPPTFFLTLQFILQNLADKLTEKEGRLATLERLYPRLQAWFDWFNVTQIGDLSGSYRWRGRNATTNRELNPVTLTSGLDDYPRASHPNVDERHVDLRCWLALAASTLSEIAKLLNKNGQKYSNTYGYLADNNLLDKLHWSPRTHAYSDFGLHTDFVVLKQPPPPRSPSSGYQMHQNADKIRVTMQDPELRFVDSTFGYVSLFPFFLQILEPESPKLGKILDDLKNPELLWTNYGLRSLAKTAPLYMKPNTEHDPPYWRGPIWINLNYMAVRALSHYSKIGGPYSNKAKTIYNELKQNIMRNIIKEYRRTGYIWEQYNDKTGEGQRSRPFTGWSSLVVLMMAEMY